MDNKYAATKKVCKKCIITLAGIIAIYVFISWLVINDSLNYPSRARRYELDFFCALLAESSLDTIVPVKDLVPVEWDYMKVFRAYATAERKIQFAGYQYANDLCDIEYEDIMSLLFFKDGKVVYFVDGLLPRRFEYETWDDSHTKISLFGGYRYSVVVDSNALHNFANYAYYTDIDEASIEDNPFFNLDLSKGDRLILTLTQDKI